MSHTESEKSCMFQDFFERSEWEKDTESVIWRTIGCCSQSFVIKRIPYQPQIYKHVRNVAVMTGAMRPDELGPDTLA